MNEIKEYTTKLFEDIKHIDEFDNEYVIKYCSDERNIARVYELVCYNECRK